MPGADTQELLFGLRPRPTGARTTEVPLVSDPRAHREGKFAIGTERKTSLKREERDNHTGLLSEGYFL